MRGVRNLVGVAVVASTVLLGVGESRGDVLGTFLWRLQPFCNVVHLTVIQQGPAFSLSGFDDNCGFTTGLPASGTAFVSPGGNYIGSFTTIANGGLAVNTLITINPATDSGTWSDNAGNSGAFLFNPATAPGSQRPLVPVPAEAAAWVNVNEDATLRSSSANLAGTKVVRAPGNPVGVYCLVFPPGAPVTGDAAVGSVQQGVGGAGVVSFITVTVTFGSVCNPTNFDVAVQTYDRAGSPADRPFTVIIPGRDRPQ